MASLAKQWFSSSLTSTASLTASLTDSLAEAGTHPGVGKSIPMQPHRMCTQEVPVGMNLGCVSSGFGTPPLSKGIPDSNSKLVNDSIDNVRKDSSSELVGNVNGYSINGRVKDSIGNDIEQKT